MIMTEHKLDIAKFKQMVEKGSEKQLIFKYNKANGCIIDKISPENIWIYDKANLLKNELEIVPKLRKQ